MNVTAKNIYLLMINVTKKCFSHGALPDRIQKKSIKTKYRARFLTLLNHRRNLEKYWFGVFSYKFQNNPYKNFSI